jgi:uncharacterized membrane protein YdbT with pleckstrin-like domain
MKDDSTLSHVILRQSPIIFITKIFFIEVLFFSGYLLSGAIIDYLSQLDKLKLLDMLSIDSLVFLVLLIIQMLLTLWVALQWSGLEYELTQGKLIQRHGIFSISEESFSLAHIESITINQNLLGRIFNFGSISLFSPLNKDDIFLTMIQNPYKYKSFLETNIGLDTNKAILIRREH